MTRTGGPESPPTQPPPPQRSTEDNGSSAYDDESARERARRDHACRVLAKRFRSTLQRHRELLDRTRTELVSDQPSIVSLGVYAAELLRTAKSIDFDAHDFANELARGLWLEKNDRT